MVLNNIQNHVKIEDVGKDYKYKYTSVFQQLLKTVSEQLNNIKRLNRCIRGEE